MKFTINIRKLHFIIILALIALVGFAIAQTPNPGHGAAGISAGAFPGNEYTIPNGNLGVGVSGTVPNNEGWGRVIDLLASTAARLSVRAGAIDGRILAHTSGWWGAPAGMIIGTGSASPLSFATNGVSRMTIDSSGGVQIGGQNVCRQNGAGCPVAVPIMTFELSSPDTLNYACQNVNLQNLCGDEDGCNIRLLMQHKVDGQDMVRTIDERIYMEQASMSSNLNPGTFGWTRQEGGGDFGWITGTAGQYTIFDPWSWAWGFNYMHDSCPGQTGNGPAHSNRYLFTFMSHPQIRTRFIIYDY